jgi:putative ABC transport system permease protein
MKLSTIAITSLRRRKARAAFLIAGLLIGIGTVVALLSLTASLGGQTKTSLKSYGANIVVTPRSKDVALSYGGISIGGVAVGAKSLSQADLERLEAIPARAEIAVVAPELVGPAEVKGQRVLLMGVRPHDEFELKRWWSVDSGRAPQNDHELVAGSSAARKLALTMGDYVRIGGRRFTVTGILRPTGSQDDALLIADLGAVQAILHRPGELTLVEIAARDGNTASVDRIAAQLSAAVPAAKVTAVQEAVRSRAHAVDQFRSFSYAIAGVVIAIEALVVFITMMGAVSERTQEIGVFRALGFRRVHITRLVLLEALAASVIAGVLGYVAGMGITYAALPLVAAGAEVAWTPLLGVSAVVLAVAIGALASLYPALRAGKLDPTEALRAL